MDGESKYVFRKVITDFVCLFIVAFPLLLFKLFGAPFERGFFCDDDSLRYPYKDSTIPSGYMYVIGIICPAIVMSVVEFIHFKNSNGHVSRRFLGRNIHPWVWNCYKVIGVFGFGIACSHLTTDVTKYSLGRLRPHFFTVCQPLLDCTDPVFKNIYRTQCNSTVNDGLVAINCADPFYKHMYIEHYYCQTADKKKLKDFRLSFPSGHTSFSACTMVYFAMYLQARMTWGGSKLLKHFIQYFCILLSLTVGYTRVQDYKHHWSDVLAGYIQGTLAAIIVAMFVSDLFSKRRKPLPVSSDDIDMEASPRCTNSGGGTGGKIC